MPNKKRMLKPLPRFENEDEEREFWATHDSTDYIDWSRAERGVLFPNLKPTSRTISLRLPAMMIAQLKVLANKRDVPYQSLLKMFVAERLGKGIATRSGLDAASSPPIRSTVTHSLNLGLLSYSSPLSPAGRRGSRTLRRRMSTSLPSWFRPRVST
jgi:predicted DNA binding CopG/RHH family protein